MYSNPSELRECAVQIPKTRIFSFLPWDGYNNTRPKFEVVHKTLTTNLDVGSFSELLVLSQVEDNHQHLRSVTRMTVRTLINYEPERGQNDYYSP